MREVANLPWLTREVSKLGSKGGCQRLMGELEIVLVGQFHVSLPQGPQERPVDPLSLLS